MRIRYLGTAAADGWPGLFCRCPACRKAWQAGGRNIRTRSQALLNDDLLLDFPADTYAHVLQYGLDLSRVEHLFITHSHMDHFIPQEWTLRGNDYAHDMTCPDLNIYLSQAAEDYYRMADQYEMEPGVAAHLHLHRVEAFQAVQAGRYTVTPLPARHMAEKPQEKPYFYLIEEDGRALLYLHDSGWPYEEVYDYLAGRRVHLDLVSFDCTGGPLEDGPDSGHMGLPDVERTRARLQRQGNLDGRTQCILNHFSHNGGLIYDELVQAVQGLPYTVAYDGMEAEV